MPSIDSFPWSGTQVRDTVLGPDGTVRNAQPGTCLDASGGTWNDGTPVHLWTRGPVDLWTCHTGPRQKWPLP
ncbi:hypothetical protein ACVV2G_29410 [Streptomyces ziwulingensis]